MLSQASWRSLFDAVYAMNSARGHADFVTAVTLAMNRLIPSDLCRIHLLDRKHQRVLEKTIPEDPHSPEEIAYYAAHPHAFPLVAHYERTGDTRARRLSDVTDIEAWKESSFYQHCLARTGLLHCLALPIVVDPDTVAGLTFNRRERDFQKQHCELLDAFAPHFRLAWKSHDDPWETHQPQATKPLKRPAPQKLTKRETEVLYWMTEGKQNREIALILDRSLNTIQEHVANIVRKLGQENRHAATVYALRTFRDLRDTARTPHMWG